VRMLMRWERGIGISEMGERALLGVFGGRGVGGVFGLIPILAMGGEFLFHPSSMQEGASMSRFRPTPMPVEWRGFWRWTPKTKGMTSIGW